MTNQSVQDRYFAMLKGYMAAPGEIYLAEAAALGRVLVLADVPPEEIIEIHEAALQRLAQESPNMSLLDAARLISAPLMEMFMAYGLAFREHVESLKQTRDEVERLSRHNELILKSAGEGIYGLDRQGNITFVNPAGTSMIGCEAGELIGQPGHVLHHSRRDGTAHRLEECPMRRTLEDGSVHRVADEVFWRKDGTTLDVEYVSTPIREGGAIVGAVITFKDIAERKRLERELIRSERGRALGDMAGGVAHNFNNILATILGRAQFLLWQLEEGKAQSDKVRQSLAVIERASLSGAAIVHRLLEFARDSARPGEALTVHIKELLSHTVELSKHRWKDEAEAQGCQIQVVLEPGPVPPVAGSQGEFQDVLLSLIFNAIEAMPQGGTLTLSSWAEGGRVCVAVKDTGVGIAEGVRGRIFDPFFTTKGPQGKGLGLSLCQGIIRRCRGEIVVHSEQGRGSTFTIKLPAAPTSPPPVDPPTASAGERLRILIVEDEADMRETFRDIVESAGYMVYEAENGSEGLEILERQPVHLVCTNLRLPDMTGWEVADRVKARRPELKVALITGWDVPANAEELKGHRVDSLITKPFQVTDLLRALSELTARHK